MIENEDGIDKECRVSSKEYKIIKIISLKCMIGGKSGDLT